MLGGAFGTLCQILFPELDLQPAAFIIVGMAGFFAGIAKVPVSALIMVAEMTGSYGLLVPTMLVATIALVLGWRTSIYEMQVPHRAESPAHRGEFLMSILDKMKVRTSMVKTAPHQIVEENMLLRELIKVVTRTNLHYFFTVDRDQRLTGMIALDELRRVMLESHLGPILVAKDLAAPPPPVVRPEDSLSDALNRFVASALDELPVVRGDNGALTGIIRKKDLVVVYTHALAETQDAAG
jgi:CIC family chloride channel protein